MSDVPVADHLELSERLTAGVLAPMKRTFVGKDEIVDLLGVCLVGGENLFIHGPPGTAKSALVHDLGRRIDGRVFDYLLTRFTEPNELFGPFDIRRLRDGELVTNTEGMLPEAAVVFLDELLNANSAILNSLLMALNERMFRRGRETWSLPTLMVVGASNSLPQDDALGALFDRFLLRVRCDNVSQEQLSEVLTAGWQLDHDGWSRLEGSEEMLTTSIREGHGAAVSPDAIRELQRLTWDVDLAPVRPAYVDLVHRLRHAGIAVSDRRAVKLQRLVAASALLCGRMQSDTSDLWVLRFIWDTEEQQEVLAGIVQDTIDRGGTSEQSNRHPRSRGGDAPDPEQLAGDLERLRNRLADDGLPAADRTALRDQLAQLSARCQWVPDDQQRTWLARQVEELWPVAGGEP